MMDGMTAVAVEDSQAVTIEEADATLARHQSSSQLSVNRQFAIVATLAAYSGVILVGVSHHEPWADEAHAWLLSRDLGYRYLVFHQLAYEGHPPLWATILWIANHWLHLPYQSLGWIGGLCAIVGCWFFCRYSPFPLIIRILFPFTYFMAFQYAIVARPYVLLPLFSFAAAHYFRDAERRPWKFVGATSALALLCAPGVMMAGGLVAARIWYTFRAWGEIPLHSRRKLIAAAIAFGLVLAFVAWVNWPPPDRVFARPDRQPRAGASAGNFGLRALPDEFSTAFLGSPIPSIAFMLAIGAWCALRRRFLTFALPLFFLLAFFIKVYGSLWHTGALTLIAVAALWIASDSPKVCMPKLRILVNASMIFGVGCLLAMHLYWSARTFELDYSQPYSGSLDAANFLRSVGADASSTCGFDFHSVAVQPYFQKGIFKNWPAGESFWRLEPGNHVNESCDGAKWVVVPICCTFDANKQDIWGNDPMLRSHGYAPVHVSRGAMFFEGRETEPTDFVIYELSR